MNKGKIIILNGVSSSGKTTLSKALQNAFSEEYLALGIDDIIGMLPAGLPDTGVEDTVRKCQTILHGFIRLLSDMGHNVIVDNIILASFGTLDECVTSLKDYQVMMVRLNCPAHELRRREQKRGDRSIGNGESQIGDLVPTDTYDVVVDTYEESIDQCVNRILQKADSPDEWIAMKQLGGENMAKVKLTILETKCRCGYYSKGQEFIVEDLCPPICHELWNNIYPSVYALQNGASLDYGEGRAKVFDAKCPDEGRVCIHGEVID